MKKEDSTIYEEKPKRTSKWLIVVIIIAASLFTILPIVVTVYTFFAFDDNVYTEFEENENGQIILKDNIKIYGAEGFYNDEEKTYYVQGYLENNSENDIEFVYIEYFVYDENDVLLGTAYGSLENLKSGTKWKYKTIYSDIDSNEVARFELSKVEFY